MRNTIEVRTPSCNEKRLAGALLLIALLAQGACGGGSSGSNGLGGGSDASTVTVTSAGTDVSAGTGVGVGDDPTGSDTVSISDAATDFPFAGTFVADEYGPSINSPEFLGIVEIVPAPLGKTRILDGSLPRAYPDGRITFRQGCGQGVNRIALAEPNRLSAPVTPCSSEVPNEGASPTNFGASHLSPDGTLLAVE